MSPRRQFSRRGRGWCGRWGADLLGREAQDEGAGPDDGGERLQQARLVVLDQAAGPLPDDLALPRRPPRPAARSVSEAASAGSGFGRPC